MSTPIFITCRDRVTSLKDLIAWLEKAGQDEIYLLDNDSTYPPLLDYLEDTPHHVFHIGSNNGQHVAWNLGFIEKYAQGRNFIVTDPDVVPDEQVPLDALDYFESLLNEFRDHHKVGFGLRTDDLPDTYKFKHQVINWESRFMVNTLKPNVYSSQIDTTFALYRSLSGPDIAKSIRTGSPYLARHMSWYINSKNPTEEDVYYSDHASGSITNWTKEELGEWHLR